MPFVFVVWCLQGKLWNSVFDGDEVAVQIKDVGVGSLDVYFHLDGFALAELDGFHIVGQAIFHQTSICATVEQFLYH